MFSQNLSLFVWLTFKLYRYANICERLAGLIDEETLENEFIDTLLDLASDRVANVRFAVARAIRRLLEVGSFPNKADDLKNKLEILKQDKDKDVVFFATGELPNRSPPTKAVDS